MSQADLEKRIKERQIAYLYVSIYKDSNKGFFGLLADLSKTGFKLVSEKPIKNDTEFTLAIKNPHSAPPHIFEGFKAKSIWCAEKEPRMFETGFEFVSAGESANALFIKLENDFEATSYAIQKLDDDTLTDDADQS